MTEIYRQTKTTYAKLGKKYIESISKLTPNDFDEFCNLLPEDAAVLDIGCAGGRDCAKFIERGKSVTGIDVVEKFLHEASSSVPGANFQKMDVLDLRFDNNSFDGVWAHAVLLHLTASDQIKSITNIFNVLNDGGLLFVSFKLGKKESKVKDSLSQGKERYFNFISSSRAIKIVESSGFKILKQRVLEDAAGRSEVSWIHIIARKV